MRGNAADRTALHAVAVNRAITEGNVAALVHLLRNVRNNDRMRVSASCTTAWWVCA